MDLFIAVLVGITSILLALFLIFKNRKSATNIYFSLLLITTGLYSFLNYFILNVVSPEATFFWTKVLLVTVIPIGPLFYNFVVVFPDKRFVFSKLTQTTILVWMIMNMILGAMGYIFSDVTIENESLNFTTSLALPSFVLLQVGTHLAGIVALINKYRKSKGSLRTQLQFVLFGIVTGFGLTLISTMILPFVFGITFFIPITPAFLLVTAGTISYVIVKHRMLNISKLVARSVAYFLLILLLAALYASSFFLISTYFIGDESNNVYVSIALAILLAFTFQPLKKKIGTISDRIFYKGYYDSEQLLNDLSITMASNLLLEDITHKVLEKILSTMKISHGMFVLFEEGQVYQVNQIGYMHLAEFDEKKVQALIDTNDPILLEETDSKEVLALLKKYKLSTGIPLFTEGKAVGFLGLGEKLSGDLYTGKDINLLSILAPVAAVAIQNSKKYEEIRRFSVTLEDEVEKATRKLTRANARLKVLDKLKDEFVSLASHELRTPMTSIKNYLWMALNGKGGRVSEKQKFYLQRSYDSTDRLIELVNDMLNISRIEAGRISLKFEKVDIVELSEQVMGEVEGKAQMAKIQLKVVHSKKQSLPYVIADPSKIKEVLINLVGNALKFTPEKGSITISFSHKRGIVTVTVKDTGVGISEENQKNLFKKFGLMKDSYKANKDNSKGSGLGLYLSKEIITLHKGEISAESKGPGRGTMFHFSLQEFTPAKFRAFSKRNSKIKESEPKEVKKKEEPETEIINKENEEQEKKTENKNKASSLRKKTTKKKKKKE